LKVKRLKRLSVKIMARTTDLDEDYGTPEMWAYMHEITKVNQCLE
jgi:hypothetical protein